jgi:hypothetical protein
MAPRVVLEMVKLICGKFTVTGAVNLAEVKLQGLSMQGKEK